MGSPGELGWGRDRVVWLGAALGAGATAWALFADRYLPYIDWSNHLGLISVLAHGGSTGALDFYTRSFLPSPYLLFYLLAALFAQAVAVDVAAKLVLVLAGGLMVLGTASLAAATGRSPRMGLVAPLAMFGLSMGWGFGSFVVATPILFFALAAAERMVHTFDASPPLHLARLALSRPVARLAAWLVVLFLAHGFLFFVAAALIGIRVLLHVPVRLGAGLREALAPVLGAIFAGVPAALALLPSAILLVTTPSIEAGSDPNAKLLELTPVAEHLRGLGNDLLERGSVSHWHVMYAAAALFAIWAVLSLFRPHRATSAGGFGVEIYAALLLALYLFGPMTVSWPSSIWMIYPRFGVIAAAALFLVPRPALDGALGLPLALAGSALALWNGGLNAAHVRNFSAEAHRYDGVRALIPRGARVFALTLPSPGDPGLAHHAMGSLWAYHMVDGAAYVAFLFDKNELPVHLRRDRPAPRAPVWNAPGSFDPRTDGQDYDYLVLRGRDLVRRTEAAGLHETVATVNEWTVLKTRAPTPRRAE